MLSVWEKFQPKATPKYAHGHACRSEKIQLWTMQQTFFTVFTFEYTQKRCTVLISLSSAKNATKLLKGPQVWQIKQERTQEKSLFHAEHVQKPFHKLMNSKPTRAFTWAYRICIWVKSKAFKQCLFCYCQFQAFPLIRRKQTYEDKMGPNIAITALSYQNEKR